jgi:hypothetical protein
MQTTRALDEIRDALTSVGLAMANMDAGSPTRRRLLVVADLLIKAKAELLAAGVRP